MLFEMNRGNMTQAEYDAKKAEVEAKYAPLFEQSKIDRNNAAAGASNASASASRARARNYDRGGGSGATKEDKQKAYDYWMSLSPEQKQQYREWNNRVTKYQYNSKTKKREPVNMKDDDDFIRDKLIENGKKTITLFIYDEKINEITNKYLN